MEMEKELEQFRQEAQRLRAGGRSGALPFPETLRAFAVRYVEHVQQRGGRMAEAAQRLGVSEPTLYAWRKGVAAGRASQKGAREPAVLVPVRVSEGRGAAGAREGSAQQLVLVSPKGWRVEGLGLEAAAELLKRLGC